MKAKDILIASTVLGLCFVICGCISENDMSLYTKFCDFHGGQIIKNYFPAACEFIVEDRAHLCEIVKSPNGVVVWQYDCEWANAPSFGIDDYDKLSNYEKSALGWMISKSDIMSPSEKARYLEALNYTGDSK